MKDEIATISPLTMYSASFLSSLGYNCKLTRRVDGMNDEFSVKDGDTSFTVRREGFFRFALRRGHLVEKTDQMPRFAPCDFNNHFDVYINT